MRFCHIVTMLISMSRFGIHTPLQAGLARRQWLASCSLLAICLSVAPLQVSAANTKTRLSLVLDDRTSLMHLPLLMADQLGFFKAEGLEIEFVEHASQASAISALTLGTADVLCASYDTALLLKQKNFDAVSVVQIARTPQWVLGISNNHLLGYKTLADLRGKRLGIVDSEGSGQRCLSAFLSRSGVEPSQVNLVNLNSMLQALVALRSGYVDALFAADPLMTALEKNDEVTVLHNFRTLKQTQLVFSGLLPGNGLIVSQALVEKHSQTCQAMVSAVVRSLKWLRTARPSDLLRYMVESPVLPDRLVYLNAIDNMRESFSLDGWLSADAQQASLQMLGLLDPSVSATTLAWKTTVRNDFVRAAKQRFNV